MRKILQTAVGYIVVIGIIATLVAGALYVQSPRKNHGKYAELIKENVLYRVINIYDGDTFVINVEGHEVVVRLIGIDTPEVVDPRKHVECYGPEASEKAKELLFGERVYIEKEPAKGDYDKYGRVLAYAFLSDHQPYNAYMIENGFAREYTFNKETYKYQKGFRFLQSKAKEEKRGLWGKCS